MATPLTADQLNQIALQNNYTPTGGSFSTVGLPTVPTTLNSTNTAPTTPTNLPSQDPTTSTPGLNTSVPSPIPTAESIINENTTQTPAEAKQQAILDKIASLTGSGKSQTTLTNEAENAAGLTAQANTINDLNTQLEGLNNQALDLQNKDKITPYQVAEENKGKGATVGGIAPLTHAQLVDSAIKQAGISSQALTVKSAIYGAQGKYNIAKDAADKAATAQYEQQQKEIDALNAQLAAIAPTLNKEEKKQAAILSAKLADRQNQIDNAKEAKKTILALATAAIVNFPNDPAAQYAANQALTESNKDNPDLAKIISLVGQYQKDPVAAKQALLNTQLTQAQINKANADAAKAAASINDQGDTVQSLAQQLVDGTLAPAELSKRATGQASYNSILVAAGKLQGKDGKPFNIAQADIYYKKAQNPGVTATLDYLKALTGTNDSPGNLDQLRNLSSSISRTKFPALNNVALWTKLETGDPSIAAYHAVITEVADQVAKILQGGGTGSATSDAKLKQATSLFQSNFSVSQINAVVDAISPLLANRAKAVIGDNPYLLVNYKDIKGVSTSLADQVKAKGYDYAAMRADGLSDEEIKKQLSI
jgi:hypothetical protein